MKVYHTSYRIGLTIRPINSNSYNLCFNGTDKCLTLPCVGGREPLDHSQLLMKSLGIRVANYVHTPEGDYTLIIPMSYWDKVRSLFTK